MAPPLFDAAGSSVARTAPLDNGVPPCTVGLAVGAGLAVAATRIVAGFLYGVSPTDAATFILTAALLAGIALLAAWFPVHRAVQKAPAVTLRAD